jgi:hypothetical protein
LYAKKRQVIVKVIFERIQEFREFSPINLNGIETIPVAKKESENPS